MVWKPVHSSELVRRHQSRLNHDRLDFDEVSKIPLNSTQITLSYLLWFRSKSCSNHMMNDVLPQVFQEVVRTTFGIGIQMVCHSILKFHRILLSHAIKLLATIAMMKSVLTFPLHQHHNCLTFSLVFKMKFPNCIQICGKTFFEQDQSCNRDQTHNGLEMQALSRSSSSSLWVMHTCTTKL